LSLKLYLDESISSKLLAGLLTRTGHDVQVPTDVGLLRAGDLTHFNHVAQEQRVLITANPDDFQALHIQSCGQHSGIFAVHYDNDPTKDPKARPRSGYR
jgi:predicted nuclease of predicted toxin-antitoxin system